MLKKFIGLIVVVFILLIGVAGPVFADTPAVPAGTEAAAPAAEGAPQQPGALGMLTPFLLMFAVLYFLMIRPQQKRMKEHQKVLEGIQQGDEVITASGIMGRVTGIQDKVVTLEIAEDVRVRFLKSQISQVVKGPIKDLA